MVLGGCGVGLFEMVMLLLGGDDGGATAKGSGEVIVASIGGGHRLFG